MMHRNQFVLAVKAIATARMQQLQLLLVVLAAFPSLAFADIARCRVNHNENLNYKYNVYGLDLYLGEDWNHGSDAYTAVGCSMWDVNDFAKVYIDGELAGNLRTMMKGSAEMNRVTKNNSNYIYGLDHNSHYQIWSYWAHKDAWIANTTTSKGDVMTIGCIHSGHSNPDATQPNYEYWIYIEFMFRNDYVGKTHKIKVEGSWLDNGGTSTKKTFEFETKTTNADKMPSASNLSWTYGSNGAVKCKISNLQALELKDRLAGKTVKHKLYVYDNANHVNDYSSGKLSTSYKGYDWEYNATTAIDADFYVDYSKVNTLYPRYFREIATYSNTDYSWSNQMSNTTNFIQDYDKYIIPCMPVPQNLSYSFDAWKKKVKLTWNSSFSSTTSGQYTYDGYWAVFRKDEDGNMKRVSKINHQQNTSSSVQYSFEDADFSYDSKYTYTIMFVKNSWGDITSPDNTYLRREIAVDTKRPFEIQAFKVEGLSDRVKISWKITELTDATTTKVYSLKVLRKINGEEEWTTLKEVKINSPKTLSGIVEDNSDDQKGIKSCEDARYAVSIDDVLERSYSKGIDGNDNYYGSITDITHVTDIITTRGDYTGMVRVNWKAKMVGTKPAVFTLQRRKLGSNGDWMNIYTVEGTASTYSYDDITALPGNYYEYRVKCDATCGSETAEHVVSSYVDVDGFALATGSINGRIYYGSGTAVDGVKVTLVANGEDAESTSSSMKVGESGYGAAVEWMPGEGESGLDKIVGNDKPWTIQMFVKPQMLVSGAANILAKIGDGVEFGFKEYSAYCSPSFSFRAADGTTVTRQFAETEAHLYRDRWYFLSFSVNPQTKIVTLAIKNADNEITVLSHDYSQTTGLMSQVDLWNAYRMTGGISVGDINSQVFNGCFDDVRFFTRELNETEIIRNSEHPLSGNEKGLALYWNFDEDINGQVRAYDYSKTDGVCNGRNGMITNMLPSRDIPSRNMFSLCGYTDSEGNYTISGIPFSGDGRSYSVVPSFGAHEFSPSSVNRMVSINGMVHNAVDFKDISSFKVSGTIWYEHTNVPVKGVMMYVDGNLASKDGEAISTDENGEFTVDVPIGDHFVSAKLNGHTFVNAGRYPVDKDGVGVRYTFTKDISGLRFFDNTLVTVAGRVVGGDIEGDKPLGFDYSEANIGSATIKLCIANDGGKHYLNVEEVVDEASVSYEPSATELSLNSGSPYVSSYAKVGAKVGSNPEQCKYIVIQTDSTSGEFAVKLPPLTYKVESVKTRGYDMSDNTFSDIDATSVGALQSDSLEINGKLEYYEYDQSWTYKYKAHPTLYVQQTDNSEEPEMSVSEEHPWDGHFGDAVYYYEVYNNATEKFDTTEVSLYTVDPETNRVSYTFGRPLFTQLAKYRFHVKEFEEYINKDADTTEGLTDESKWVRSIVPVAGDTITIRNEFATTTIVDPDNDFEASGSLVDGKLGLDENGEAYYVFQVGLPKLSGDYSRAFVIQYGDNLWTQDNGLTAGIVMGLIPQGNDFVTGAPDDVTMILRAPGGSGSKATWTKGTTTKTSTSNTLLYTNKDDIGYKVKTGIKTKIATGVGVAVITEMNIEVENNMGIQIEGSVGTKGSETTTTTVTQAISTIAHPYYSGHNGDLFIGTGRNTIIGRAKDVTVQKKSDGTFAIGVDDVITKGSEFKTAFAYSQYHITNILLPEFKQLRDALIEEKGTPQTAFPKKFRYISKVPADDPGFGEDENVIVLDPTSLEAGEGDYNEVEYYNNQIKSWIAYLRENEEAKLNAIKNCQDKVKNYSFDSGSTMSDTYKTENTSSEGVTGSLKTTISYKFDQGVEVMGTGETTTFSTVNGFSGSWSSDESSTESSTFSYTLAETGKDYLTIDVYEGTDKYGSPIFVTRGGMTSCPYEDEYKAQYADDKETVLSAKTIQKENFIIDIPTPIITGVPNGEAAIIKVNCTNVSPITYGDYANLELIEGSNPDGLMLNIDGVPVTSGRTIWLNSNEMLTKTLTVTQSNPDILEYRNVRLRLSSTCSHDIKSDASFDVIFLPAGANVKLSSNTDLVNANTTDDLKLYMSDYNINAASLDRIELQYRTGNGSWTNLKQYVKPGDSRLTTDAQHFAPLIVLGSSEDNKHLVFPISLHGDGYADGTYQFRAESVCTTTGGTEVRNSSEVLTVVRDIHAPQPLGNPTPTNGVLGTGDDVSITFNEDVRTEGIVKGTNIVVTGLLNDSRLSHDVAASFTSASSVARTQTTVDLSQQSFTFGAWLYCDEAGTMLTHGSADQKMTLALTSDNHLKVTMAGKTATSAGTVPLKKWVYVSMAYDNDEATLLTHYAYDSTDGSVTLNDVEEYNGNGSISLGGFKGRMHELTLWNRAMSWAEQKIGMDVTKNRYTPELIGYWPMNEGTGSVAEDYSRSRHISLPAANAWAMATANYAAETGADHIVMMPVDNPCRNSESYVVEEWFRADADNTDVATLLAFSNGKLNIFLNDKGNMQVTASETTKTISNKDWRDGQWHHLAMATRLSSGGMTSFIVDGSTLYQMPASLTPAMQTSQLWAGGVRENNANAKTLKGGIDEVRMWKGVRTADVIRQERFNRIRAVDEPSLALYYPFEKVTLDESSVAQVTANTTNQAKDATTHLDDGALTITTTAALGMKAAKVKENVDFSFVANERKIVIKPEADPQRMEGCTLTFETRYLQDANGNYADNVTWTAYVQQNDLKWAETEIKARKVGVESVSKTVTIVNRSASRQDYVLSGLPTWLTTDAETGYVEPLASKTVELVVDPGTPVGKREAVIYLTGMTGISEPLFFSLTSAGDVPDWKVTPGKYESNMNIIGQMKIDGSLSTDEEDMVAAFIGTECRGVAHPQYISRDDSYYLLLNIYADGKDADKPIVYKMYDASTGIIYPTVSAGDFAEDVAKYVVDGVVGSVTNPVVWTPLENVEQHIDMNEGWNWISFGVKPDDNSLPAVFGDDLTRISMVKGKNNSYMEGWASNLNNIASAQMYKVKVKEGNGGLFTFVGKPAQSEVITLNTNWSWISYPMTTMMSLNEALVGANPEEGDIVKSQTQFSIYDNGAWLGSLAALVPGEGYLYNSHDNTTKTFTYPVPSASSARVANRGTADETSVRIADRDMKVADDLQLSRYENNMSVMAVVKNGDEIVTDAVVRVYATDGTCCGHTDACVADTLHFITVGCDKSGEKLRITVQQLGSEEEILLAQPMTFGVNDVKGSVVNPLVLQLNDATGITDIITDKDDITPVYDVAGRRVNAKTSKEGIYIKHNKKVAKR